MQTDADTGPGPRLQPHQLRGEEPEGEKRPWETALPFPMLPTLPFI